MPHGDGATAGATLGACRRRCTHTALLACAVQVCSRGAAALCGCRVGGSRARAPPCAGAANGRSLFQAARGAPASRRRRCASARVLGPLPVQPTLLLFLRHLRQQRCIAAGCMGSTCQSTASCLPAQPRPLHQHVQRRKGCCASWTACWRRWPTTCGLLGGSLMFSERGTGSTAPGCCMALHRYIANATLAFNSFAQMKPPLLGGAQPAAGCACLC